MLLVGIAWLYVVVIWAAVEASSSNGSLLGAAFTLVFYGALPLAVLGYLFLAPARRRARRHAEASTAAALDPDQSGHAAGEPAAPVREEP